MVIKLPRTRKKLPPTLSQLGQAPAVARRGLKAYAPREADGDVALNPGWANPGWVSPRCFGSHTLPGKNNRHGDHFLGSPYQCWTSCLGSAMVRSRSTVTGIHFLGSPLVRSRSRRASVSGCYARSTRPGWGGHGDLTPCNVIDAARPAGVARLRAMLPRLPQGPRVKFQRSLSSKRFYPCS